uniref:NADH dehydrogenase subunit 2 n=1 Tax=Apis koschevnikovi TaxID=7468 RepID=A0A1V0D8Q1_APIKO|nr:NADH dehydrogenase subunit 2 [Apis koschevnikovi]BAW89003.1 NADH dehydrogenase subunit 2 [Apis koschevnikovi]
MSVLNLKHNLFVIILFTMFVLMMNTCNVFIQWVIMEFSTIISISLINIKSPNKIPSLIYYMISVISSVFLFLFIIMYFSSLEFTKSDQFNFLIQILFYLKIGMFPFHYWMIFSYEMMNWKQIFLMSTLIKFIPIYMFVSLTYINLFTLSFLTLGNVYIAFYTNKFYSLKKLLACSTIFNSMYFILLLNLSKPMFITMIIVYSINYLLMIGFLNESNIHNLNINFINKYQMYAFIILMLSYSMYPIMLTFVIKWNLIYMMISVKAYNWIMFFMMVSSTLMTWNYMTMLKSIFMKMKYYKNEFNGNMKYYYFSLFTLTLLTTNVTMFVLLNFFF